VGAGERRNPTVRHHRADYLDALRKGRRLRAMPSHASFCASSIRSIGHLAGGLTWLCLVPLLFPGGGLSPVGPFAALGLYELSRRREAGVDVSASDAFDVLRSPSIGAIVALGCC
jgi:uncharacterized membrane protein